MLPNFMIIGIAKCGTTTLCNILDNHPQIFITNPKEPNYFNKSIQFDSTRDQYEALFENAGSIPFRGEGSVGYTNPNRIHFIPKRIHEVVPNCKLIFMVRHPIKRMESEWKMHLRQQKTKYDFTDALQFDMMLYNHGMYWNILSHYLKYFEKEQILVVFMEDLVDCFDDEIVRILTHIGADTKHKLNNRQSNSADSYRKDTGVSTILKGMIGKNLKSKIPDSIKDVLKGHLTSEWEYNFKWDSVLYTEVAQFFIEDSQALLEYITKFIAP